MIIVKPQQAFEKRLKRHCEKRFFGAAIRNRQIFVIVRLPRSARKDGKNFINSLARPNPEDRTEDCTVRKGIAGITFFWC
jgi:hypothetical protein